LIRFFGKIKGTERDYFIAETIVDSEEEKKDDEED
jgi:hypothetical protein